MAPVSPRALARRPIPSVDGLVYQPDGDKAALLVDMGSSLTAGLQTRLREMGWPVAVLHLGTRPGERLGGTTRESNEWWLDRADEGEISGVLNAIQMAYGSVAMVLFLATEEGGRASEGGSFSYAQQRELLKQTFFLSKFIGPALVEDGRTGFAAWLAVTPAATLDSGNGVTPSFEVNADRLMSASLPAGLHGLAATLRLEWPSVFCRAIDIEPGMPEPEALDSILDGLFAADRGLCSMTVGRQGVTRPTSVAIEHCGRQELNLGRDDVVLATGGARGITARCVLALAAVYPCHYVLLGKTKLSGKVPDWFSLHEAEAVLKRHIAADLAAEGVKPIPKEIERLFRSWKKEREVETTLTSLRATGARADYLDVDLADGAHLEEVIERLREGNGHVRGLIHGAGDLADHLIKDVSPSDFEYVVGPKVDGLFNLLRAIPLQDLSFVALFSSLVALSGNVGQSHYGLANAVLNHAAVRLQNALPNCRVLAFDWGPWELGMVGPALRERFGGLGIDLIGPEEGAQAFVDGLELTEALPVLTVGELPAGLPPESASTSRKWTVRRRFSLERDTFLWDHVIGDRPVLPAACAADFLADGAMELCPGYAFRSLKDFRVLKGITFDQGPDQQLFVSYEEQEGGEESRVLQAWAWTLGEGERRIPRYKALVELVARTTGIKQSMDERETPGLVGAKPGGSNGALGESAHEAGIFAREVSETDLQGGQTEGRWSGAELYRRGLLFHGPSFQGLGAVWGVDERGLAARCNLSASAVRGPGSFAGAAVNPFLCDSMLQTLVAWTQLTRGVPCLPAAVARLEMAAPLSWGQTYRIRLDVREVRANAVLADVDAFDEAGSLVLRVTGVEGTMSSRLAPLFLQGASISRKSSDSATEPRE
jgi:NAD(P)-dependent dehydrogenase (short-subunit alcohol dehydrogenase family)